MSRNTARKYSRQDDVTERTVALIWRTRKDPLEDIRPQAEEMLRQAPELKAKAPFEHLAAGRRDEIQSGLLPTFQRRAKAWRIKEAQAVPCSAPGSGWRSRKPPKPPLSANRRMDSKSVRKEGATPVSSPTSFGVVISPVPSPAPGSTRKRRPTPRPPTIPSTRSVATTLPVTAWHSRLTPTGCSMLSCASPSSRAIAETVGEKDLEELVLVCLGLAASD